MQQDSSLRCPIGASRPDDDGRLHHLDALRAAMMLLGVMVHGAALNYAPDLLFEAIRGGSGLFRMACFFLIGGYFSALLWVRAPGLPYVLSRTRQLLVPLLAALLLVVPLGNWLAWCWHEGPVSLTRFLLSPHSLEATSTARINWHGHMWFLAAMLVYAAATPWLASAARRAQRLGLMAVLGRLGPGARLAVLAGLMGGGQLAMRAVWQLAGLPLLGHTPLAFLTMAILTYLPFFALGVLARLDGRVLAALQDSGRRSLVAGLVLAGASLWGLSSIGGAAMQGLAWVARGALAVFIIAGLMQVARRWCHRPSPALRIATDAALSFYIFHLALIYAVALAVRPWLGSVHAVFAVVVVLVPPLMLGLHLLLIRRWPLMRMVWTGRRTLAGQPASSRDRPILAE